MQNDNFLAKVQEKSGLSKEESLTISHAVLQTLGERLTRIKRQHLAAQLPGGLKTLVNKIVDSRIFSLESFYLRVAARSESSFHQAIEHSRNVLSVVLETVSKGELDNIFSELPPEFGELLGQKPDRIKPTTADTHELFK